MSWNASYFCRLRLYWRVLCRWRKKKEDSGATKQGCFAGSNALLTVFWHVGGSHSNYRKRGGSQYISDAMGIFLSTILGCEINTEIKFHSPLPTTHSSLSSWTLTCTRIQRARTNTHFHVPAHSGKKMSKAGLDLVDFNRRKCEPTRASSRAESKIDSTHGRDANSDKRTCLINNT